VGHFLKLLVKGGGLVGWWLVAWRCCLRTGAARQAIPPASTVFALAVAKRRSITCDRTRE
jgi:hypothetical protein